MTRSSCSGFLVGVVIVNVLGTACTRDRAAETHESSIPKSAVTTPGTSGTPVAPEPSDVDHLPVSSQCEVLAPNELPGGTVAGLGRRFPGGKPERFLWAWGRGGDQVVIGSGQEVLDWFGWSGTDRERFPPAGAEPVVGRDGIPRRVIAIGDPPLGQITYQFLWHGCPYIVWTASGMTWSDALAYASRLATPPLPTSYADGGGASWDPVGLVDGWSRRTSQTTKASKPATHRSPNTATISTSNREDTADPVPIDVR